MEIALYNRSGKAEGKIALSDKLFGAKMNADLVYQIATSMMSNKRKVIAHTKTRSEVSGGGKKPWRQKGTGRARHGSIRSPIWVGGGVAHGPTKDVNFKKKINRVQARAALAAVLSARAKEGHLAVVEGLEVASGKTKDAIKLLGDMVKSFKEYSAGDRVLVVLAGTPDDAGVRRATQNLKFADTIRAQDLNTLTVLSYPFVLLAREAVEGVERMFAPKATTR